MSQKLFTWFPLPHPDIFENAGASKGAHVRLNTYWDGVIDGTLLYSNERLVFVRRTDDDTRIVNWSDIKEVAIPRVY